MKKKYVNLTLLFIVGLFLSTFYTNCSKHQGVESSNVGSLGGGGACEDELMKVYSQTVHPFLNDSNHCKNCHVEGGIGLGSFASNDPKISYEAFQAAGLSKISTFATNPGHKPPYTGPQNQSGIDSINAIWPTAENNYLACLDAGSEGLEKEFIRTSSKVASNIYVNAANNQPVKQTLTWELDNAVDLSEGTDRAIPAIATVDVQLLLTTPAGSTSPIVRGYIFSNPTIQLKSSTQSFIVEGMYIYINDKLISNQTTYISFSKVLFDTQVQVLESAQANTFFDPVSVQDSFSLYYRRLVPTSSDVNDSPPLTPILSMRSPSGSTTDTNQLNNNSVNILRDSGIVRWCLTENNTAITSTEQACAGGQGPVNGWHVNRPGSYNFAANSSDGSKTLYLWVANNNLRVSSSPATYTINLDRTAPAAVSIAVNGNNGSSTVSITDMQVANLTVSDVATASAWCVMEIASTSNFATPALNNDCWRWSYTGVKPTTVGFTSGGFRKVAVYVRDVAGNISTISNTVTANNTLGPITYSELINPSGGNRAVFYNNCRECHMSAGQPGFTRLQLFDYTDALRVTDDNNTDNADNSLIVSRTNNPLSPMPNINSGLMNIRYRDMIRLWVRSGTPQ